MYPSPCRFNGIPEENPTEISQAPKCKYGATPSESSTRLNRRK